MLDLKFRLDGKIASVNTIYVRGRNGGVFISPEVRKYREDNKPIVKEALKASGTKYENGIIKMSVKVCTNYFTKADEIRKVDIDNTAKQILDTVFPALDIDDKTVFELNLKKVHYEGQPYVEIKLKESPNPAKRKPKSNKKVGKGL